MTKIYFLEKIPKDFILYACEISIRNFIYKPHSYEQTSCDLFIKCDPKNLKLFESTEVFLISICNMDDHEFKFSYLKKMKINNIEFGMTRNFNNRMFIKKDITQSDIVKVKLLSSWESK